MVHHPLGTTRLGWAVGGPPGMWRLGSHAQGTRHSRSRVSDLLAHPFQLPQLPPPQSCLGAKAAQAPVIWHQPRSARPEGNTMGIFLFKFDFYIILKYSWFKMFFFFFHCKGILIHLHIQMPHYSFGFFSPKHVITMCSVEFPVLYSRSLLITFFKCITL